MTRRWEPGCYGDGAFGHQHTRESCAGVLLDALDAARASLRIADHEPTALHWRYQTFRACDGLIAELRGEMSDDASEEYDAEDLLNEIAPVDGHFWGWQDGDFGLWPEESEGE
jgi:hypothetical protein